MRGADYVPKKKAKKPKKAAKVEKALGWGGFDDQAKATQARPCTRQPLPAAPRGLQGLWRQWSARRPERAPLSLSSYCWAYATSVCLVFVYVKAGEAAWMRVRLLFLLALQAGAAVQQQTPAHF